MIGSSSVLGTIYSDPEISRIFSDAYQVALMVKVEVALAKVQEELGIIPPGTASRIATATTNLEIDLDQIRRSMERSGVPSIGLVDQLRAAIGGEAASYIHWGATTQDIVDTALVLQIREALDHISATLDLTIDNLAVIADRQRDAVMAGRTKAQQALPYSFGLKVAGWLAPLVRHRTRLVELQPRLFVVQFGGAVGTLAALGDRGLDTLHGLASELGLGAPPMAWHTQRDTFVECAGWLSLVSGSLAKMAQDIILLAQSEVGEVRESADPTRGGSSTMPQKSNPIVSEAIIAAARANANLISTMHQAMIQEHERGAGSWQIEWLTLPRMFELTASAVNNARFLSENLVVDTARMRANLDATGGLMLAEALNLALAPHLGRAAAKTLVQTSIEIASAEQRHLVAVVREQAGLDLDWDDLHDEVNYLGQSDDIIDRVIGLARQPQASDLKP